MNNPQMFLMCGQLEAHWRKVHRVNQDLAIWQNSNMEWARWECSKSGICGLDNWAMCTLQFGKTLAYTFPSVI
jgi:hypothetical protein